MSVLTPPQGVVPAVTPHMYLGVRRPAIVATGAGVAMVAALVLGSWWAGFATAPAVVPGWRVMVPGTAFSFLCVGAALMVFASGRGVARVFVPALAAAAITLPVLTIVEYATGERFGVERWFGVPFAEDSPVAGRMSPVTALSFAFLAVSLAALPWAGLVWEGILRLGAGTALTMSWLAVVALAFDMSRLADAPGFPGMAVLTMALMAASSVGVLASSTHALARLRGARVRGAIAPGLIVAAFAVPLLLGRLRVFLDLHVDRGLAMAAVVITFAMVMAAFGWRLLARLEAYQTNRERLLADLEHRVDERTQALASVNRELHDSKVRLVEADRRKDEFLATLAHELRNPLAPIRTGLEILKSDGLSPMASNHAHQVIGRQMRHLVRLIDDLLDVSRITANKLELRLEPVDVAEILHQGVETARADVERARHALTLHLPPPGTCVLGDPTRLTQIVANLLQNASKYTPRGGHILLEASAADGNVDIRVRDDGIGIAADDVPRLFEKFSQVVPALQGGGGLGLGLALVRGLVALHGGTVTVNSAGLGQGSEFVVRLPRAAGFGAADDRPANAAQPEESRRVLVVDDNVDNAEALALYLRQRGHLVETAFDGEEACDTAERFRPDAVLLDIGLPKMSGHDVCRFIRRQPWGANIQIIAQTGWGQETDRLRSRSAGFDDHLVKPVDPGDFTARLARTA
jgi:signal transduction histidine kinase/CheY-like chemotaxis protein